MVIDRYIAKSVVVGCLLASFILLSIFAFVDFVSQLQDVGKGDYGTIQAISYVFLGLFQRLYELSPSILLLGGMLSLGTLAASSELIVMRASGISIQRITRSVIQIGLLLAILVAAIGEYVVPSTTRLAKTYRAEAMEEKLIVAGNNDIWVRDNNRYVNAKQILPDYEIRDVRVYEFSAERKLTSLLYAKKARYSGDEWILNGVERSKLNPFNVEISSHDQVIMKTLIMPELFSVLALKSKDMSANELLTYSEYLNNNSLDNSKYLLDFWIKIFTPLTCIAMLLISMPIVFSATPRSGGVGQRIMLAMTIGVVYFVINRSANHLGLVLDIAPAISASAPMFLVILVSVYFMRKVH